MIQGAGALRTGLFCWLLSEPAGCRESAVRRLGPLRAILHAKYNVPIIGGPAAAALLTGLAAGGWSALTLRPYAVFLFGCQGLRPRAGKGEVPVDPGPAAAVWRLPPGPGCRLR